ncbi:MAG: HD-GYP domain-containing protein [Phycisphaerae bacterium]
MSAAALGTVLPTAERVCDVHAGAPARANVLYVDDDPAVHAGIERVVYTFKLNWELTFVLSVRAALAHAARHKPDVIISDVTMPGENGFVLLSSLAASPELRTVPTVMVTGNQDADLKRRALQLGAVDLLNKPVVAEDLIARISSALRIARHETQLRENAHELERRVQERTRELEISRREIVLRLAAAGEFRDTDTGAHVRRVAMLSRLVAERLGLTAQHCDDLALASMLHDIGKIAIPDGILRKPGKLEADERAAMQQHCAIGYRILSGQAGRPGNRFAVAPLDGIGGELMAMAARIALCHHERWDGRGYPERLAGAAIPLEARIVAIADVCDALHSPRPYKAAIEPNDVRAVLSAERGAHFDPAVTDAMLAVWPDVRAVLAARPDAE